MHHLINWPSSSFLDLDRFFDLHFSPTFFNKGTNPKVDIKENESELVVKAELPGLTKEDISVELKDSVLTLSGEKKIEESDATERLHRTEISYGSFSRSFYVPSDIDAESIEANFEDGILQIVLPKAEKEQPTKITVK